MAGRPVTAECGSRSAYKRHLYRREEPCSLCRKANAKWMKEHRKRK